jgi:hypothetical protein
LLFTSLMKWYSIHYNLPFSKVLTNHIHFVFNHTLAPILVFFIGFVCFSLVICLCISLRVSVFSNVGVGCSLLATSSHGELFSNPFVVRNHHIFSRFHLLCCSIFKFHLIDCFFVTLTGTAQTTKPRAAKIADPHNTVIGIVRVVAVGANQVV